MLHPHKNTLWAASLAVLLSLGGCAAMNHDNTATLSEAQQKECRAKGLNYQQCMALQMQKSQTNTAVNRPPTYMYGPHVSIPHGR